MSRGQRIARGLARGHDALRSVFLEGQCLKLLGGTDHETTLATYDSGWYLDKHEYSDVIAGKKYKRLVVEDLQGCRKSQLRAATAVQVGDDVYKFHAKDSFLGSVPSYEFKVYAMEQA